MGLLRNKNYLEAQRPISQVDEPGITDVRHYGVVKSFSEGKFGFLVCEGLAAKFQGKDVLVPWKHMNGHLLGEMVSFSVIMNKERKIQAVDLQTVQLPDACIGTKRQRISC